MRANTTVQLWIRGTDGSAHMVTATRRRWRRTRWWVDRERVSARHPVVRSVTPIRTGSRHGPIAVFDRALSAARIVALAEAGLGAKKVR